MYYPSSENKGADQLRGYREADLRLCFRLCGLLVFPWGGSNHAFDKCDEKFSKGHLFNVSHDIVYLKSLAQLSGDAYCRFGT